MRRVKYWLQYWKDYLSSIPAATRNRALFDGVERYCMFLGYPRSGHTLYGALLDAHQDAVIAHELDALFYVERGISRNQLYALLLKRDRWFIENGCSWSGFSYRVPNQHQGSLGKLRVIGDKKGGVSATRLRKNPNLLTELRGIVRVPLRIFHILRNPFDNISTMCRRNEKPLEHNIDLYFNMAETNGKAIASFEPSELMVIRHEDFISRPRPYLRRMVEFIGLTAEERYVEDCAGIVIEKQSRSRDKMEWPAEAIKKVQARMRQHSFLDGYSFEN